MSLFNMWSKVSALILHIPYEQSTVMGNVLGLETPGERSWMHSGFLHQLIHFFINLYNQSDEQPLFPSFTLVTLLHGLYSSSHLTLLLDMTLPIPNSTFPPTWWHSPGLKLSRVTPKRFDFTVQMKDNCSILILCLEILPFISDSVWSP